MIKAALVGAGGIGKVHYDAYQTLDNVKLVAAVDPYVDSAREKLGDADIPIYADLDELFANEQVDMVDLCIPSTVHMKTSIQALEKGVHVLCEKPMAMNTEEALKMKEAAEKNGKLLMIGFVRRHGNDAAAAINYINKGHVGDIYYAKATYLRRCGFPGGWFGDKSRSGGGPLIDLGVHVIDLSRYIMGCPKPVTVFGATFNKIGARSHIMATEWQSETVVEEPIFTVEDLATAMIRFDNGAVLQVEASFNLNIKNNCGDIVFFGDKAGLSLSPFELYTEYNNQLADIVPHGNNDFDFARDFRREVKNFTDAINGKAQCIATADDGVELMRILDAIYLSAETGKSVDIVR